MTQNQVACGDTLGIYLQKSIWQTQKGDVMLVQGVTLDKTLLGKLYMIKERKHNDGVVKYDVINLRGHVVSGNIGTRVVMTWTAQWTRPMTTNTQICTWTGTMDPRHNILHVARISVNSDMSDMDVTVGRDTFVRVSTFQSVESVSFYLPKTLLNDN